MWQLARSFDSLVSACCTCPARATTLLNGCLADPGLFTTESRCGPGRAAGGYGCDAWKRAGVSRKRVKEGPATRASCLHALDARQTWQKQTPHYPATMPTQNKCKPGAVRPFRDAIRCLTLLFGVGRGAVLARIQLRVSLKFYRAPGSGHTAQQVL